MKKYLDLLQDVLYHGTRKENRTGIDTLTVTGRELRIDLREGFPCLTTKKVFFRGVFEEWQMMLRGQTNTKIIEEKGVNYWKGNTSREFLDSRGMFSFPEGDMGAGYGHQMRNFGGTPPAQQNPMYVYGDGYDQLDDIIRRLKHNPNDRRIIMSYWNPQQMHITALPPCHLYTQLTADPEKKELTCFFLMRSCDLFLGLPTNLIMYGLLTHYLAKLIGYTPRELIWYGVDSHIYTNHIDQVEEQLGREPRELPKLAIKKDIKSLEDILALEYYDIDLVAYDPHPAIKAPMAV